MTTESPNYKNTLNLPKTTFDMKANLTTREPAMLKQWQAENLYQQIRNRPHPKGKWVLHDGPPYANGDIHMGHLINKTLKDIVVKFRTMQGFDSPYVPGWDCHGLPIESAIQKKLGPKMRDLSKDEIRKLCHDEAMKWVAVQSQGFQRLGILGEFNHPYLTLNPQYESGVLEVLAELVKNNLVYRQKKPVHWCTNDRTALAEAELEYANRKDNSIYVSFVTDRFFTNIFQGQGEVHLSPLQSDPPVELLIWTTTPWTLPANRAVAVNPTFQYDLVRLIDHAEKQRLVVIAHELVSKVVAASGSREAQIVSTMLGADLANGIKYFHPLVENRKQPVVLADYVTLEDGTGLVHTAPGHGYDDYLTALRNHLEIYNPVLPDGRYDDTVPTFLRGQSIWDANQLVIDKLQQTGALFHHQPFDHSYPHCWRCKKPVIFRATEQWFVKAAAATQPSSNAQAKTLPDGRVSERLDNSAAATETSLQMKTDSETRPSGSVESPTAGISPLWQTAKKFVQTVQFIPPWGKNRLDGMLDTRPDWCISRQRSWGVPIPAFFDEKGNILFTPKSVNRVAEYFRQHGADAWYTHTPQQILGTDTWTDTVIDPRGKTISEFSIQTSALTKGSDILDVWFESGASHHAVLECTHPELGYPADMYLEGSDQHRGWFQSSLLEAAGYKSEPPFKNVLTHGFIVDQNGRKMSKSEGNDIKVNDALKEYGADILRLWVASVDYQNDIPLSKELLKTTGESYRKIRNTIRYLLGNLYDFNPQENTTEPEPYSINAWMTSRLNAVTSEVTHAYDTYEFHRVFRTLYEFCNVDISATYAKAIKDRLYCEFPNSPKRRASQTVCYRVLVALIEHLAPVLVFTAEEAWTALKQLPGCSDLDASIHLRHAAPSAFSLQNSEFINKHWAILMPLIEKGNKQLDELKKTVNLGNPLDAEAVIIVPSIQDELSPHIAAYGPEIEDALGVGYHRIEHGSTWDIKINDTRNLYPSCARSWKRRPDVGSDPAYPDLSARDAAVVRVLRTK